MYDEKTLHTHAVVVSIGDEIAQGEALDTNTQWLARELVSRGIRVVAHVTCADEMETLTRTFAQACERAPLVISTGGLGPTADDLTREALSRASGQELVEDDVARKDLEAWFEARGRDILTMNTVQAMRPERGRCLPNPHGTAPGIWARIGGADVYALPGPPREMKPMFDEHVAPGFRVDESHAIVMRSVLTAGISESSVAQRLGEMMDRDRNPNVATTASLGVVTCRLRYDGADTDESRIEMDALEARVRDVLGRYVFATGQKTLQETIVLELEERGACLVTAESCTGGLVSEMITSVPGCSGVFPGGCISYSNGAKIAQLGVKAETIGTHGAVSRETAREMLSGVMARYAGDWEGDVFGISITGVAGPSGGSEDKPVGTVWIGAGRRSPDGAEKADIRHFRFPGPRSDVRRRSAVSALMMVRCLFVGDPAPTLLWQES